jgi:hypothetical protein
MPENSAAASTPKVSVRQVNRAMNVKFFFKEAMLYGEANLSAEVGMEEWPKIDIIYETPLAEANKKYCKRTDNLNGMKMARNTHSRRKVTMNQVMR